MESLLLVTFANRLDTDQAQQNVWPDLDPTQMVFLKDFFEKVDFEINQHHEKFSGGKELILLAVFFLPKIKVSSLRNYTGTPSCTHMRFCIHEGNAHDFFCGYLFY